jgi:hypothetical protein
VDSKGPRAQNQVLELGYHQSPHIVRNCTFSSWELHRFMTTPTFGTDRRPDLGSVSDTCQDPSLLSPLSLWRRSIFIAVQIKCKAGIRVRQEHENLLATICRVASSDVRLEELVLHNSNTNRGKKGTYSNEWGTLRLR